MIVSNIKWFGSNACLLCDGNCAKAWGINSRPSICFDEDEPDDNAMLPDHELDEAPANPGTYEGGHGKPQDYTDPKRHNKWCARECERSVIVDEDGEVELPSFDVLEYNMPWLHKNVAT